MLMRIPGSYFRKLSDCEHEVERRNTYAGVDSGDGDERAGAAVAAVDYIDLSTTNVELSTAVGAGNVESDLDDMYSARG